VFCGHCGRENLDTVQFCVSCGALLAAQRTPPPGAPRSAGRPRAYDPEATIPAPPPGPPAAPPAPERGPSCDEATVRPPLAPPARSGGYPRARGDDLEATVPAPPPGAHRSPPPGGYPSPPPPRSGGYAAAPRSGRREAGDVGPALDVSVGYQATGGALATPRPPSGGYRSPPIGRSVGYGATAMPQETDDAAAFLAPGDVVAERYAVKALLGHGGMGAVYRVEDTVRGCDVALKVMLPSLLARERAVERFTHEAELALRLSHEGIVRVFDVGEDRARGLRFYTMELLEGLSLRAWIEEKRKLHDEITPAEAIRFVAQVLEALVYAHATTVHRDLKPENVMVLPDGRAKILDFGIAKLHDARQLTSTSTALGTVYYMAPEQQTDAATADARADLYSVAVILYELLTGRLPVGRFRLPSEERKALPPKLDALLLRGLEAEPERRHQSAAEMLAELREAERDLGRPGKRGGAAPPRRRGVAGAAAALVLLLGGGAAIVLPRLREGASTSDERASGAPPPPPASHAAPGPAAAAPPPPAAARASEERAPAPEAAAPPAPSPPKPVLAALEPAEGAVLRGDKIEVRGRTSGEVRSVSVNGLAAALAPDGSFLARVPAAGRLLVRAAGPGGEDSREVAVVRDDDPPEVRLDLPARSVTREEEGTVGGEVRDAHAGSSVLVNGAPVPLRGGRFAAKIRLSPGENRVRVEATDLAGNASLAAAVIDLDRDPPVLVLAGGGADPLVTRATEVPLGGRVVDAHPALVEVNGARKPCEPDGSFAFSVPLDEGENVLSLRAVDAAGNVSPTTVRRVLRDTRPPEVSIDALPARVAPGRLEVAGTVDEAGCEVSVDGAPAAVDGLRFRASVEIAAAREVVVVARDRAGNEGRGVRSVDVASDLGEIVRVDAGFHTIVVRAEVRGLVKVGDLLAAVRAGRPVGRLRVKRLLPPTGGAPEGSFSTEPDRGGPVDPFHPGDRVRAVRE
jgi:hypothetical protein